jgi:hypothetical protein
MSEFKLPPDLADLERRLANRPRIEPPANLGDRVHAAIRDVLRPALPASDGWGFWAAVAAVVFLGINLSMSLAADTDWNLTGGAEPGHLAATAERLRALAPELPEDEVQRQALLVRAGAGLPPTLPLAPSWQRIRTLKERD